MVQYNLASYKVTETFEFIRTFEKNEGLFSELKTLNPLFISISVTHPNFYLMTQNLAGQAWYEFLKNQCQKPWLQYPILCHGSKLLQLSSTFITSANVWLIPVEDSSRA